MKTSDVVLKIAEKLEKDKEMNPPEWSKFVKSGANKERPPQQKNWWYLRSAAILKKVHADGPVGIQRLRTRFGSRKRRGHKPAHHYRAGGKVIRTMIQQLEKTGYIQQNKTGRRGRVITSKGQRIVDRLSK